MRANSDHTTRWFLYLYFYVSLGRIDIDFEKEPISGNGEKPVYLADIWPTRKEVQETELNLGMKVVLQIKLEHNSIKIMRK